MMEHQWMRGKGRSRKLPFGHTLCCLLARCGAQLGRFVGGRLAGSRVLSVLHGDVHGSKASTIRRKEKANGLVYAANSQAGKDE